MIYTVTLNPSLDYYVTVENFALGRTNRTREERLLPGGKGINVSRVLGSLGCPSTSLGFLAGFVGEEIRRHLEACDIRTDFIFLENGCSRINVKLKNYESTEINGSGPAVDPPAAEALMASLETLKAGDGLVLAGSVPASLPSDIYSRILERLSDRDIRTAVDASGDLLTAVLPLHPFLIKPNRDELSGLLGMPVPDWASAAVGARRLQAMGARVVIVSLGGDGAVMVTEEGRVFSASVPQGKVVNAVGAGDAMVAGFLAGLEKGLSQAEAFRLAAAAGTASAFSEDLADGDKIYQLLAACTVTEEGGPGF